MARMKDGTALTDEDRGPWLARLGSHISDAVAVGRPMVLACSALRRAHRSALLVDPGV
jgi:gluconokinase